MNKRFQIHVGSKAIEENTIRYGKYRFTLLTEAMMRIEYSLTYTYTDQPTQTVWFRNFPIVEYIYSKETDELFIKTKELKIICSNGGNDISDLEIQWKDNIMDEKIVWHYGDKIDNLRGTTRTLDKVDGSVELEDGILSKQGITILEDSATYVIDENGELKAREEEGKDFYIFGYGRNYKRCLQDYYRLTGGAPLLPRYALGNWWSRFHRYSEEEYMKLIEEFQKRDIPLSVAMLDMDWHLTEIDPKYGDGWTGYTWNKILFPEPKRLLKWLHERRLKVSLNVHPAGGVRAYEDSYEVMAKALQVELPISIEEAPIEFNATSPAFLEAYFRYLHEPNEQMGVDFWWVDWQQGQECDLPGLDPLWVLNHYHYLDNKKNGNRSLILSRYAGPGSHRYPIGFSGDSIISWDSLAFQPYFTVNASNVGYGWWSNDIGGHMLGYHDEELQIRWVQFGVFSPVNRLHSSSGLFNHKEPWNYSEGANYIITKYLQLRHKMIPYTYTMNEQSSHEGIPLLRPLYYENPWEEAAYRYPNEYYYGSEMICCPITTPIIDELQAAKVDVWLPEGNYVDLFNGIIYDGQCEISLYRGVDNMPVLLKAGGIIPFDNSSQFSNKTDNPSELEIVIVAGANGILELYEDDGESFTYQQGESAYTKLELDYNEKGEFRIHKTRGDVSQVPAKRYYKLRFLGFDYPEHVIEKRAEREQVLQYEYNDLHNEIVLCIEMIPQEEVSISFSGGMRIGSNNVENYCFSLLDKMKMEYEKKDKIYNIIKEYKGLDIMETLSQYDMNKELLGAIREVVLAMK